MCILIRHGFVSCKTKSKAETEKWHTNLSWVKLSLIYEKFVKGEFWPSWIQKHITLVWRWLLLHTSTYNWVIYMLNLIRVKTNYHVNYFWFIDPWQRFDKYSWEKITCTNVSNRIVDTGTQVMEGLWEETTVLYTESSYPIE